VYVGLVGEKIGGMMVSNLFMMIMIKMKKVNIMRLRWDIE